MNDDNDNLFYFQFAIDQMSIRPQIPANSIPFFQFSSIGISQLITFVAIADYLSNRDLSNWYWPGRVFLILLTLFSTTAT